MKIVIYSCPYCFHYSSLTLALSNYCGPCLKNLEQSLFMIICSVMVNIRSSMIAFMTYELYFHIGQHEGKVDLEETCMNFVLFKTKDSP
jgi:hypothetical protein